MFRHRSVPSETLCHGRQYFKTGRQSAQPETRIDGPGTICTGIVDNDTKLCISLRREVLQGPFRGRSYPTDSQDSPTLVHQEPTRFSRRAGAESLIATGSTKNNIAQGNDRRQTTKLSKCVQQYQVSKEADDEYKEHVTVTRRPP